MADLLTIKEAKGRLRNIRVTYVGDGNNVARSLALGMASVGGNFSITSPKGYELDQKTLEIAQRRASRSGASVCVFNDVNKAVANADVVYTDVWTSMGQEGERQARLKAFKGYTVDKKLMSLARPDAIFMHDMPAHYGEEVAQGMLDDPSSVAFQQAENRLHAQKAILEYLLGPK
jgi:ornithine carbamoyltransferase